ncbi:GDP-mannose 4,6-dehydratase [Mycobacterium sp. E2733]|uniref:GDP-mannose 4,6-dehydratase n=1 Tax=Mycobacterium sp. E2733 TaxID=1834138 RepID=UPI000AD6E656|nr:GDP-mannose 4,6-dehydratase [Mycobacterium sp. E2733]
MIGSVASIALIAVLVLGVNTLFWTTVGLVRVMAGLKNNSDGPHRFVPADVAVLLPAHNEEAVLGNSLQAVLKLLPPEQIHVVSDGSSDDTVATAKFYGVNVYDLNPNRGKAGALSAAIEHFELAARFKVLLLLDADTRLADDYLDTGLPGFDDPDVVAVAGHARCQHDPPPGTLTGRLLIGYRARLYAVTQLLVKYGQASRWTNAVTIVPGFASMYRTDILAAINITAPGLVIEDFNMTFEVHANRLGRIAFHPGAAVAYTQDPDDWRSYLSQVKRWTLGYWQTVRSHGLHLGVFWTALAVQILELVSSSVMVFAMPPALCLGLYSQFLTPTYGDLSISGWTVAGGLPPKYMLTGFVLPDVALTAFAAVALRRPTLLLMAPVFPLLRFVEAYVCLRSIPAAWRTTSTGRWISPKRRMHVLGKNKKRKDNMISVITGGAGFIGSHLVDRLLAEGDRVVVLDDLSTGSLDNLRAHLTNPRMTFIEGSVLDRNTVETALVGADRIFHLAAAVGVRRIIEHPLTSLRVNLTGTENVLDAALAAKATVVLASTSEIYGKNTADALSEDADRILGSPLVSRWSYAAAKGVDECFAHAYHRELGLKVVTARLFNTVGPRQTGFYGMVVPNLVSQALRGEPLTVFGTGHQTRCFSYVGDIVPALIAMSEKSSIYGQAFNLGGEQEISIRQLAERIIELTYSTSSIKLVPYKKAYGPGYEDMQRRVPDNSAARKALDFKPSTGLDQIILAVADYQRKLMDAESAAKVEQGCSA